MTDPLPSVTLVVAMRNEEAAIERCLASIAAQTYPQDQLEVFVFDGESTDRSFALAEAFAAGRPGWHVRPNPKRIQAAAWNAGIAASRGDIAGIVSGHAELEPDYVAAAVRALEETGADMVGGPVHAISEGAWGEAIALATGSAFGVGGTRHHRVTTRTEVDTVFMGVCRRETWLRFPFAEEMVRNQDDELSYRLLEAGGRIVADPAIRSRYRSRPTLGGLWRQYFDYGRWKVRVLQAHPARARVRHVAPAALVSGVAGSTALGVVWEPARIVAVLGLAAYAGATGLATAAAATGGAPGRSVLRLPVVYPVIHAAYGAGMLRGLWQFRDRWGQPALAAEAVSAPQPDPDGG